LDFENFFVATENYNHNTHTSVPVAVKFPLYTSTPRSPYRPDYLLEEDAVTPSNHCTGAKPEFVIYILYVENSDIVEKIIPFFENIID